MSEPTPTPQQYADHLTGAGREHPPAPVEQPINPTVDSLEALHHRRENT